MAKFITMSNDLDKLISDFRNLDVELAAVMGRSVYKGAGYMADKLKTELKALPTVSNKKGLPVYMPKGKKADSISKVQKQDLINAFGISKASNENGYISVKIGFDGYGSYETPNFPNGIPNQLLIRSLEKGTSFLKRNPVITKTVKREKAATENKLEEAFMNEIEKELK